MLEPTDPSVSPKGGWTIEFTEPEPVTIRENHHMVFLNKAHHHMIVNGLDRHGWKEWVLDTVCRQRPDIPCFDREVNLRDVTGDDIIRFIRTIWSAWRAGAQPVSAEEQERRVAICKTCPMKGYVSCLGGCSALAQALTEMTIGGRAREYPEIHRNSCLVCGCELSSLIMFPLEVLQEVDRKINFQAAEYPAHCWKKGHSSPQPEEPGTT